MARQLHEDRSEPAADLRRELLAPPPAPFEGADGREWSIASRVLFGIGGFTVFGALMRMVNAANSANMAGDPSLAPDPYQSYVGLAVAVVLFAVAAALRCVRSSRDNAAQARHNAVNRQAWAGRMQVWEQARVCLTCRGAFFPEGVLRAGLGASPLIALDQFPLMVVTMAERVREPVS